MKNWNWSLIGIAISIILSVSSVLSGCAAQVPTRVIVAEPVAASEAGTREPAAVVPKTDLVVQSGKADDGNFYARIVDTKNGVICYSVTPANTQNAAGISCIKQ